MIRFGKTCIVHTSDFAHLEIHNNHTEWHRFDKGIMVLQSLKVSHIFVIPKRFYESLQLKIGCVNNACFPNLVRYIVAILDGFVTLNTVALNFHSVKLVTSANMYSSLMIHPDLKSSYMHFKYSSFLQWKMCYKFSQYYYASLS